MSLTLRHAVGSLLVVGLSGTELTGLEHAWLKLVRPAGIILFRRNIISAQQTRALLNEAASLCTTHNFRCVDLEGGAVDRLRDALAPMPSAQAVARTGNEKLMHEHGELVGRAVKAFGFNTTLAPVLDLALPASAQVMGTRAAAPDAESVVRYVRSFLAGLRTQCVAGCGKHFPGLGGGTLDSHLATPEIHRTMRELWREDLAPFRQLRDELPMIMVNHATYPDTQGKNLPASASRYWITKILRERIGYRGIIFSDDLEMGGILKVLSIEDAAIAAIRAGMDLIEICHSPELILRAYEALIAEAERSAAFCELLINRANRSARLRMKLFAGGSSKALTENQFQSLRSKILTYAEVISKAKESKPE
jgi:beta-N-acetylhexosaminidase